ncbi:MAG: 2-oxo-hepta-3-ene-1,7-dioic acid hydratase [Gammaproteobacteria bacterium]|nr:2-oxo-hepta-3-ene-1,7-dioic acid hydratase [Gammaproteobacteria bacterium]
MLSTDQIDEAARALDEAERSRRQVRPVSLVFSGMDITDAYAVQDAWMRIKQARGHRVCGRKIGLTSRAMQQAMRIDEPDYGTLLDSMFFDNEAEIDASRFTDPRLEVELAFELKKSIAGPVTLDDVLDATAYVRPAVEIIAARSFRVDPDTGRTRTVLDTIADNAASAGVVLGGRRIKPNEVDLRWVSALLSKNGTIEESGVAAAVLGHPGNGIVWLANRFAPHGVVLEAGQIFLAGSFTRPVVIKADDRFQVDYGDLGTVSCRFE